MSLGYKDQIDGVDIAKQNKCLIQGYKIFKHANAWFKYEKYRNQVIQRVQKGVGAGISYGGSSTGSIGLFPNAFYIRIILSSIPIIKL